MNKKEIWEKCAAFHGHECGGLTIGYKAALYAMELLDLTFPNEEELVCVSENKSCSVDAIRVILGCTEEKGNLFFRMNDKQAFDIYNKKSGESIRLVLKETPAMTREESFVYFQVKEEADLFDVMEVDSAFPETENERRL